MVDPIGLHRISDLAADPSDSIHQSSCVSPSRGVCGRGAGSVVKGPITDQSGVWWWLRSGQWIR